MEASIPSALFIESAWNGNGGSWQYKIAKYQKNMGDELNELLLWAKKEGIPTIFWNKEDPPHYERFIDKAKLFDFVFTSDANMIPNYRKDLGHKRVYPLPFAAQPAIHNPILSEPRKFNVCFAGTYYGDIYPERKRDMELLLKPALEFELHIYDRQYGMAGYETSQYRFPQIYRNAIRGKLEYSEMVKAYKQYRVFLNVNSVKDSPTMFSRRVFELLASGTVVISTYSKGIEEVLGSDVVLFADSESETKSYLQKLINDDDFWNELSIKGIRRILEYHTYNQRLFYVFEKCHVDFQPIPLPQITILSKVENSQHLKFIERFAMDQTYRQFEIVLYNAGCSTLDLVSLKATLMMNGINLSYTKDLSVIMSLLKNPYVAVISPKDYYFCNYLKDYALATIYGRDFKYFGKGTYFSQKDRDVVLQNPGKEFNFVSRIPTATLMVNQEGLRELNIKTILEEDCFELKNDTKEILSLDHFNYLQVKNIQYLESSKFQKVKI